MKRRKFLQSAILLPLLPAAKALARPTHPPLDKPWPLDIRKGFDNCVGPERYRTEVYLDGVLVGGAVAVSVETGHVLKFMRHTPEAEHARLLKLLEEADREPWTVYNYKIEFTKTPPTPRPIKLAPVVLTYEQPCSCAPGMHVFEPGDQRCVPYEIKQGHIELRMRA